MIDLPRSRSFSIYLLKDGFDETNSLVDDSSLRSDLNLASDLLDYKVLILDGSPYTPWWVDYFGIIEDVEQDSKGLVVFIQSEKRCFALAMGHVAHHLKHESFEYDFGLKVTLNSVDAEKLKSIDIIEPTSTRRSRTQLPRGSELTYFDFERDSSILRNLTGAVKPDRAGLFSQVTGASSLRVRTDVSVTELKPFLSKLLEIYNSDEFKVTFPDIMNISPIRDPAIITHLNVELFDALSRRDASVGLVVPDIINYYENRKVTYTGAGGKRENYEDVDISDYFSYLHRNSFDWSISNVESVKKHKMLILNEEEDVVSSYSIWRALIFDVTVTGAFSGTYHLSEGSWYQVEANFVATLQARLDPHFHDSVLPEYQYSTEGEYNERIPTLIPDYMCLDRKDISPKGQKQVEPCDLLSINANSAILYHVKISTQSDQLSHLFNQGVNAVELLKSEEEAVNKLKALVEVIRGKDDADRVSDHVKNARIELVYAIITAKDRSLKSQALPLFSRISLSRCLKSCARMSVDVKIFLVPDLTVKSKAVKPTKSVSKGRKKGHSIA